MKPLLVCLGFAVYAAGLVVLTERYRWEAPARIVPGAYVSDGGSR